MADDATFEKYTSRGKSLGLTGLDLVKYVQECEDRDIRAEQRQKEREKEFELKEKEREKELELKEKELELKEKEREREIEIRKSELEAETALKEKELEVRLKTEQAETALKEKELELEKTKWEQEREDATSRDEANIKERQMEREHELAVLKAQEQIQQKQSSKNGRRGDEFKRLPKLPHFNEEKDDIDAYISRFEKWAADCNLDQENWPDHLSYLLTGNALNIVQTLQKSDLVLTWIQLKEELLKRYQCSAPGFRDKFRKSRPQKDESFLTYLSRVSHAFDRWVELAGTEKSYAELRDLFLREQFVYSLSRNLQTYLMERNFKSVTEMADAAENFRLAHPEKVLANKDSFSEVFSASVGVQDQAFASFPEEDSDENLQFSNVVLSKDQFSRNATRGYRSRCARRMINQGLGRGYGQFSFPKSNQQQTQQAVANSTFPNSLLQQQQQQFHQSFGHANKPFGRGNAFRGKRAGTQNSIRECYVCRQDDHLMNNCPMAKIICSRCKNVGHFAIQCTQSDEITCVLAPDKTTAGLYTEDATVNGFSCTLLRDTGCTTAGVRKSLVKDEQYLHRVQRCKTFGGQIEVFPLANIYIDTPYYTGEIVACVIENPVCDLILGNTPQVSTVSGGSGGSFVACHMTTRAQAKSQDKTKPLPAPDISMLKMDSTDISRLQKSDSSLTYLYKPQTLGRKDHSKPYFQVDDDLLYRYSNGKKGQKRQLVIPENLRSTVLRIAHDAIFSGHCGIKRTLARVTNTFFWPGVTKDVKHFCKSCDICQKTVSKGRVPVAPLEKMPSVGVPFEKIAVDIVGPLPLSEAGFRYILTIVDCATRFPEAIPLKNINTVTVAEGLWSFFSRVGLPKEILSDCGSQFLSDTMKEVFRLLSISHVTTTPYHPQSNGMVERFNGTLKSMLKKVASDKPKAWHRFIPGLLFSYRELPNETLGFSPFELVFGHSPRGPIQLLSEQWAGQDSVTKDKNVCEYVFDLHNSIHEACEIAQESALKNTDKYKAFADRKAKSRTLKIGSRVLVLLTNDHSKLLMQWKGPFTVVEKLSPVNYKIDMDGTYKVFHINMLKEYFERSNSVIGVNVLEDTIVDTRLDNISEDKVPFSDILSSEFMPDHLTNSKHNVSLVFEKVANVCDATDAEHDVNLPTISVKGETWEDVVISEDLSQNQIMQIKKLLYSYKNMLTDKPGKADKVQPHKIVLNDNSPVRVKPYPLPFAKKEIVKKEIQVMLDLGVIEPSESPFSSPIVLIPKPDGSVRFCIDYRVLNSKTQFDAEPIPDVDEMLCQLSNAKYFVKIDLAKGYWQIPMSVSDKEKTAFQTPFGLFQWTRMPFGLQNAPATFARMMRMLNLESLKSVNFFDDILMSAESWPDLLLCLDALLSKLNQFGLTVRPTKMLIGFKELPFLGHTIAVGHISPDKKKVEKILSISVPTSKKQIRSLLGLLSYYRRYVPHFASVTAPLTELTKGGNTKHIVWTKDCQNALEQIQKTLNTFPILILPNLQVPFIIRTDASSKGMGAVLLQEREDLLHPVHFASKKFTSAQERYSTIERECLAIVWACQKFARYLLGKEFILQTDHRPLTFLKSGKCKNHRLLRWALALQEFKFTVKPLPGTQNTMADLLSRI